jgi:hypothetical protein
MGISFMGIKYADMILYCIDEERCDESFTGVERVSWG